jgi:hypothetical protein
MVEQRSDTLFVIRLGSGETVEFADSYGGTWETSWAYRYEDYLDRIDAHLIGVTYYEGSSNLLIGAARGDTTVVDSRPVVSPSAGHFITASAGGEAGYDPTRIRIWRIEPEDFVLAFSHETDDWGFSDPVWQREDSVTVVRHAWSVEDFPETVLEELSLVLREGQWSLVGGALRD